MKSELTKLVGQVDEHYLVREILSTLRNYQSQDLVVQPGDDAAVLTKLAQPTITADLLIENVHFKTSWSSAADIGTRAAAANLADLIAMGANPVALTVSLGLPNSVSVGFVLNLIEAIAIEAAKVNAQVVGGDVTRSENLVISISAIGDCEERRPILRSGAKPGDLVGIIGRLGHAHAGWQLLQAGFSEPAELITAHQRPEVNYQAAMAAWPNINAMIDVSDGLAVDLNHIATAAEVAIELDSIQLQELILPSLEIAATSMQTEVMEWLLTGGDDHAFAFTASVLPAGAVQIGQVKAGTGIYLAGKPLQPTGYRHFNE
jgi:thiamine-monophosphate kinase